MSYKEALTAAMTDLAQDPLRRFVGYGLLGGKGGGGTMKHVPDRQCAESTVAENMMLGMAHGMAMAGLKPVVYLERADFIHCAMDALVNHLDKCEEISRGEFNPCVIIRVTVGNQKKPLFTGPTHTSNPTEGLRALLKMPVYELFSPEDVASAYERAKENQDSGKCSTVLVEHKDLW